MIDLDNKIKEITKRPSDINEHIPTMIEYGRECSHITEMGVREGNSTWTFLHSKPDVMISYDVESPRFDITELYDVANSIGVDFTFIQKNVLDVEIEETDLLFIDTWHAYIQLKKELELHADKSRKYIILHDTTTFASRDGGTPHFNARIKENRKTGLWPAIEEFVDSNDDWKIHKRYTNNNGLTILKRI